MKVAGRLLVLLALVSAACTLPLRTSASDAEPRRVGAIAQEDGVARAPTARALLAGVELHQELVAPVPYDRDEYAPGGWADSDGDCQSDRHEILIDESLIAVTLSANGCRVETGSWIDRFDGQQYFRADEVTVDHLVALSAAHQAGAWAWDLESKQRFAHDIDFAPAHGVAGPSVNQAKADKSPDQWQPPLRSGWCDYSVDWILVKIRWGLAFSISEADALNEMLDTCASDRIELLELANPTMAPAPTATSIPAPVALTSVAALVTIGSCDARSEQVVLENRGTRPEQLTGWVLHDRGKRHSLTLDGTTIGSGQRLTILSGETPLPASNEMVWKAENVWNNSGDTATLIDSNGSVVSVYEC